MLLKIHISNPYSSNFLRAILTLEDGNASFVDLPETAWRFPAQQGDDPAALERYGRGLFEALMQTTAETRAVWESIAGQVSRLRVEIDDPSGLAAWELLRGPQSPSPLSVQAQSFVRTASAALPAPIRTEQAGQAQKTRILFVVPRIRGEAGERFQSTALRMVNGLCPACRDYFQLDWLDSPSLNRLEKQLSQARQVGKPYHLVHYEGYAAFILQGAQDEELGFLVLEGDGRPDLLGGKALAKLLLENEVALLALHAAHDGGDSQPETARGLYAVACAALSGGLAGALVMPRLIDSETAARTAGDLYAALAQGESLGAAAASKRRYLWGRAGQTGVPSAWSIPLVFESQPLRIAARVDMENAPIFRISIQPKGQELFPAEMDAVLQQKIDFQAPGLDEWLFLLDQAFENNRIVLLQGPDGTGKTTIAGEYARWQGNLGALAGQPVLYTSLRDCFQFSDLLDTFGLVYEKVLLERGIFWQALDDREREKLIGDLAKKVPTLWIWDQIESIHQPELAWEELEWAKAVDFLKSFPQEMGCILLLSTKDESALEEAALVVACPRLGGQNSPSANPFAEWARGWGAVAGENLTPLLFVKAASAYAGKLYRTTTGKVDADALFAAETGLRAALEIALQSGWHQPVDEILPALRLAMITRRQYTPLARLLERCVPLFITVSDGKGRMIPGRGEAALRLIQACVEISRQRGKLSEARLWQTMRVDFLQAKRGSVRNQGLEQDLNTAISHLAELHLEAGSPAAIDVMIKGYRLALSLKDSASAARYAMRIAGASTQIPAAQNLSRARRWVGICRKLLDAGDGVGQARCLLLEGRIAYQRFLLAQKANAPLAKQLDALNSALSYSHEALEATPATALGDAARTHEVLGHLYLQATGMADTAVGHYDQAIRLYEETPDLAAASSARLNLAVALFMLSNFELARGYAQAALGGFEALGPGFLEEAQKAQRLLQRYTAMQASAE